MPYERGRAHLEIGCRSDLGRAVRQQHLRQAAEIFAHLGCRYDLDLANRALEGR
jgi:hypothetical protein